VFLFSFHKSLVAGHRRSPMSQLGMLGTFTVATNF
jgi:hypothetical protein